jgi:hypothetical protein
MAQFEDDDLDELTTRKIEKLEGTAESKPEPEAKVEKPKTSNAFPTKAQAAENKAAAVAATPIPAPSQMDELIRLTAQREKREQAEQARADQERGDAEQARLNRKQLRDQKDQRVREKEMKLQARCSHEKGLAGLPRPDGAKFYNIYAHRLPDGKIFIQCRDLCAMRWNQGDTREYLIRDGKKVKNHTGKSFADMWLLLPRDSFSSSEIQLVDPTLGVEEPVEV